MSKHGLLLLTYRPQQISSVLAHVGSYLRTVNRKINNTLYIWVESNQRLISNSLEPATAPLINELVNLVPRIYVEAHRRAPLLDVRVLHQAQYHQQHCQIKRKLQYLPEIIFTNESFNDDHVGKYLESHFEVLFGKLPIFHLDHKDTSESGILHYEPCSCRVYDYVCLGGTFDNLHNGHKIMLSTAQLKTQKSLTIGVTDQNMIKNKVLWELIESPKERIDKLSSYLTDIDPFIEYKISSIQDPFGPAIVDPDLEAIVVSEETVRGGHKINEIRQTKNMSQLQVDVIPLLKDGHRQHEVEEDKVSSSSMRIRKLGTLLRKPEPRPNLPNKPYIIGLTGMIASGKTSIAQKLGKLGAGVINVDLLAHQTYSNQTMPAFKEIVSIFGSDIVDKDGNIDRPKLGRIVFEDKDKLTQLNEIIWPETLKLVFEKIKELSQKYQVIVLESPLLIEGNRMNQVHQIWLTILDEKEAIRRVQVRNQLTEEEAIKRVQSLIPSNEKVKHANVIFCTYWDEKVTWEQVKRAWEMLNKEYIESKPETGQ
ncbi:hypothetical protein RDWZM_006199 [Blomia tropicalis]|uniref:Cytidyltransferase-like domain-containing protein n=1 Tax=Blomia tropicalis TaxID=40697 RepID=A0A9Q0M7E3_BLOTA|nr:hypothetical protein RDWZM_006199 [Blomia tropicalis]